MTSDSPLKSFWTEYTQLAKSGRAVDARLSIAELLKRHHPNHHVINADPLRAEFLDFAAAGHATATLDTEDGLYDLAREWHAPPGGRTYGAESTIGDKVYFGRYKYKWEGKEFVVFRVSWKMENERPVSWYFVLYPRTVDEGSAKTSEKCEEIDALLLALGDYSCLPHEEIFVFEDNWSTRSKAMYHSIKQATWEDVIMDADTKSQVIKDVVTFFDPATKALYKEYNLPYKRGVIFHGPPGNGKTITIKALINRLMSQPEPVPTLYVKSMIDRCNGNHASLKRVFAQARRMAPCLVIFEDLDSLVDESIRSHFLNEVDGLEANDGILMLGSTNHLDNIDVAIRSRPSRFDRKYKFDLPGLDQREMYARYWKGKLAGNAALEFPEEACSIIAKMTEEFSFAYLKELFITTLLAVARGVNVDEIEWDVVGKNSAESSTKGDETPKAQTEVTAEKAEEKQKTLKQEAKESKTCEKCTKCEDCAKQAEMKDEEPKEPKKKREVPEIDIPETLKKNVFLAVLQQQVKLLLKDMDDSDEEEQKNKKKKTRNFGASFDMRWVLVMLHNMGIDISVYLSG